MNKSMAKTFDILKYILNRGDKPVTPSELADATGLNAPTCIRILNGLISEGYVIKKSRREGYLPGPAIFSFGSCGCFYAELVHIARPIISRAAAQLGRRTILTTAENGWKYILVQETPNPELPRRNAYNDFYCTTSGHLLLAYLSDPDLTAYIKHNGPPPAEFWPEAAVSAAALKKELAAIRHQKYCRMTDTSGNICLAVPLIFPERPCVCLSSYVLREEKAESALAALKAAAAEIRKAYLENSNKHNGVGI